uniref:Uncharacterized protein MANES_06G005900 n=1 Tax=Rhizophora mucronata TaxID=61149 RepID=A0A2P2M0C9_RHIMU
MTSQPLATIILSIHKFLSASTTIIELLKNHQPVVRKLSATYYKNPVTTNTIKHIFDHFLNLSKEDILGHTQEIQIILREFILLKQAAEANNFCQASHFLRKDAKFEIFFHSKKMPKLGEVVDLQ